jgi:hypothetical protein
MNLEDFRDHVDTRLDRLEANLDNVGAKLDDHLQRLTAAETALEFVKGHLKLTTAIGIAVVGTIASWWFTQITGV